MPLSYASDNGATRICQREAKARERSSRAGGGCGRGYPSSHGSEIFVVENLCMKTAFSRTLNAIIRGSLCSGTDQFPPVFRFLLNLSRGIFPPLFFFSFFLLFPFFLFPFFPFSLLFSFLPFLLFWGHWSVRGGGGSLPPPLYNVL